MAINSNVDFSIRHIDGLKLEYSCVHNHERASFNLTFDTSAAWLIGAYGKQELHRFSLTVNAASVAKFNRLAEAIADIFGADDSEDAPLVEAISQAAE
jgi:hypothetical protein